MQRGDIVHGDLLGHVDGLADAAGQERLHRRHHPHVAFVVDRVVAHRAGEHGQVLGDEVGRPEDRLLGVDVSDDVGDLPLVVPEVGEGAWHRAVDDRHRAAADELLRLDETELRFDAGGVGIHHEADRAGGRQDGGLRVAHPELLAVAHRRVPGLLGGTGDVRRQEVETLDAPARLAVHAQHAQHVLLVGGEPGERAHARRRAGAGGVGVPAHQRGERTGPCPSRLRVVGQAERHQRGPEVGVAEAELAEGVARLGDLLGGVVGPPDEDLLRRQHHLDRVAEGVDVEAVVVEELQEVDRGEIARAVVEVEILAAGVAGLDAAGARRRVPAVDGGVELQTGVGALPCGLGDLAPQVAGRHGAQRLTGGDRVQRPVGVGDDRLHELVGDAHRVVGVLVLHRERVAAVEVHVEAVVAQDAGLAFLDGLAPHELLDVRVVDVEDHHLGGAPRLAAGLDRAGRGVGAAHEAHRSGRRATAAHSLDARADVREVGAGAGPTLEDDPLLAVPLEDRVHRVVDPEDEARRRLRRDPRDADVEPHRAVERRPLRDEHVLQLGGERGALGVVGEVAALGSPAGDRVDHPVDDLAQRRLAAVGAERAAEVLLGDDVAGVERPVGRELDRRLLERHRAGERVGDAGVAALPHHLVVRIDPRRREEAADADAGRRVGNGVGDERCIGAGSLVLHLLPASPVACVSGGLAGVPDETTSL